MKNTVFRFTLGLEIDALFKKVLSGTGHAYNQVEGVLEFHSIRIPRGIHYFSLFVLSNNFVTSKKKIIWRSLPEKLCILAKHSILDRKVIRPNWNVFFLYFFGYPEPEIFFFLVSAVRSCFLPSKSKNFFAPSKKKNYLNTNSNFFFLFNFHWLCFGSFVYSCSPPKNSITHSIKTQFQTLDYVLVLCN